MERCEEEDASKRLWLQLRLGEIRAEMGWAEYSLGTSGGIFINCPKYG